jgi:transporter family-2 protein
VGSAIVFLTGVGLLAGFALAFQAPVNAGLARAMGSVFAAVACSFFVGLLGALVAWGVSRLVGVPTMAGPLRIELRWYHFTGGLLGLAGVIALTFIVPRMGAAGAVSAVTAGQLICGLTADRLGWLVPQADIAPRRYAGAALVLVAVWLMRR